MPPPPFFSSRRSLPGWCHFREFVALLCRRGFLGEFPIVPEDGGSEVETVQIRVGVDVGSKSHHVGIAGSDGRLLEEFEIAHSEAGFQEFFDRIELHRGGNGTSVSVAMEGYNGHSRPLDRYVQQRGYSLYSVNNLKLARFREIFPGAAKTDQLDTRKILELFHLKEQLPLAKDVLQRVVEIPGVFVVKEFGPGWV